MPEEPLERVRGIYRRWGEGDFRGGTEHYDPDAVLVVGREFPETGAYEGIEAIADYMRDLLRPWSHFEIAAEELIPAGERVVARVHQRGIGESSGIPIEFRYYMVWTLRGGRVVRIESIRERAEALAAAGLPA